MIHFSELLAALPATLTAQRLDPGELDPVVGGVGYDSRAVRPGDLFVALPGALADGHDYLRQAVELGATSLLVEQLPEAFDTSEVAVARVRDSRRALAPVAARFYGWPAEELSLIGITGTNGKTSTATLTDSILAAAGRATGLIGTVETRYGDHREPSVNTTPESLDLQRTLRAMRNAEVEFVTLEVSSHGLALGRVEGCRFAVAAMTNLTQDHLDFHETMQSYLDSKLRLFRQHLDPGAAAVVNLDDPAAEAFCAAAREARARLLRVSSRADSEAELRLEHAEIRLDGSSVRLQMPEGALDLEIPLVGEFNIENTLVAVAIARGLGIAPEAIARGVANCPQVPGRVERVGAEFRGAPVVLVDYAHTPDAVDKLLRTLRPLARGRLITVFGCGGDRDRSKRPLMARAVARYSDRTIATSDNPRTEDPAAILADVEVGLEELRRVESAALDATPGSYTVLPERREAIELALQIADAADTVVIAGKGHEDYQILGREKLPFDDRREALRALREARA